MKRIAVCGAFGFLGQHFVKRLRADGHFVRAIGRHAIPSYRRVADEQYEVDLTRKHLEWLFHQIDEVYQLAGEVGGLGYIENKENDAAILSNSMRINLNVLDACVAKGVKKIFFASSACVYPSLRNQGTELRARIDGPPAIWHSYDGLREADAYPAQPTNAFGWEKLFAERLYAAYASKLQVRIGRLHNTYGPLGTWQEPRAKVVAALCRKVALLPVEGGEVELWGDGTQRRSFTYVDDAVEGMVRLMASDCDKPVNIGSSQMVTIHHLLDAIGGVAGKRVISKFIPGPVGVHGRNSDNTLARQVLGWEPVTPLVEGLKPTYEWVAKQVLTTARETVV